MRATVNGLVPYIMKHHPFLSMFCVYSYVANVTTKLSSICKYILMDLTAIVFKYQQENGDNWHDKNTF